MAKQNTPSGRTPGRKPETLKVEGVDWEDAVKHALHKGKPEEGWDEPKRKRKKKAEEDEK